MADTIHELKPNDMEHRGGWYAVDGSKGTVSTTWDLFRQYTSDGSDATYVGSAKGNMGSLSLKFGTFAIPARAQVRWIRPRIRVAVAKWENGWVRLLYRPWVGELGGTAHPDLLHVDVGPGINWRDLAMYARNPWGNPWTQGDIDLIRLNVARGHDWDPDEPRIFEERILVAVNEAPTIVFTGPADEDATVDGNQVTSTSTPLITFTYDDFNGDLKERHHLYVIPESVYAAPGFKAPNDIKAGDAPPAGSVWYQRVLSSATEVRVTTPLPNGKYRVYGAAADVGSNGRYGPTAFREWTQNVPGPNPPTVVANVDVANARIALPATASATDAVARPTEFLRWEFLDESGAWLVLRGAERVPAAPGDTIVAYDNEAPPNEPRTYRVRAGRVVAGQDVVSAAAEVTATQILDSWWLKDPFAPSLRMRVECYRGRGDEEWRLVSSEPQGIFPVLGARYDVTIGGPIKGDVFDATFTLYGNAQRRAFEALRDPGRIVLLQNPGGEGDEAQWYIRFGPDRAKAKLVTSRADPVRRITVECNERGRPQ